MISRTPRNPQGTPKEPPRNPQGTQERWVTYANLGPKKYEFQISAKNAGGVWQKVPAKFSFSVDPHFTATVPFYLVLAASVLALALASHRFRLNHHRRIQSLEHQLAFERERSRIAKDIHDDIGASLTRIQLLGQIVEGEMGLEKSNAKAHSEEIAATARNVAQRMDEIVWAIDPRKDHVSSFVDYICHATEEILQPAGILCRLDVAEDIPDLPLKSDVRHNLYLLVKEALHNVIKHSDAKEVTLGIHHEKSLLSITIQDNGRGFQTGNLKSTGNGFSNMQQRASELGGECRIETKIGVGTKVSIIIPQQLNGKNAGRTRNDHSRLCC